MRKCCIKDCLSCDSDIERSFFEITNARTEWLNIIKQHQLLDELSKLYVCDLHFNPNDLKRHNKSVTVKKNAPIYYGSPDSNGNDVNDSAVSKSTSSSALNGNADFQTVNDFDNENHEQDLDRQTITIPLQKYKTLMDLIVEVEKLRDTNQKLKREIELKDSQLKEEQQLRQTNQANYINVSHFSAEQREVIDCLVNGIQTYNPYPESVRKFSLRQQYYSMAAYQSLRFFFNKNLPSKRALQMWYGCVDGSPGISTSAMDILSDKSQKYFAENNHRLHVSLIWDEMSIRKQLSWCNTKKSFVGFCTAINSTAIDKDEKSSGPKLAKDALVWMVVGPDFKLPVAYELLYGLESNERAALLLNVIRCVEQTGVVIMSVTSDGLPANFTSYESLGVNFDEGKPYFKSPTQPQQNIYIILDPPHMIKLVRKHFSKSKVHYQDELVDWELLKEINEKQSSDNFNLCNKLSNMHINWHQKPMNTKIAAETISMSVANTITQLRKDGYEKFKNGETTETFLQFFNNGFDILNFASNKKSDGKFKQKLSMDTADNIFDFANHFKEYISNLNFKLKTQSVPVLISSSGKGFYGFYVDFISLEGIYNDFVINGPLQEFYTFQFSQDHLETFFSLIRNSLGRNDNPDAAEFLSAFKKLLVCHPLITSVDHNVITNATGILTTSSNKKKQLPPPVEEDQMLELELQLDYETVMLIEIEKADQYEQHLWAYIALCVEEKFIQNTRSHKFKCNQCADILLSGNDKINDELLAMKDKEVGQIQQPSMSTLKIIIFGNAVMKMYSEADRSGSSIHVISKSITEYIDIDDLYNCYDFSHHESKIAQIHKKEFLSFMIETYISLKSQKICKKITDEEKGDIIRHKKKREVILRGQ